MQHTRSLALLGKQCLKKNHVRPLASSFVSIRSYTEGNSMSMLEIPRFDIPFQQKRRTRQQQKTLQDPRSHFGY